MAFAYRVYLSHRYRSPDLNLYFYELFTQLAGIELHFEVDEPGLSIPTNVTRLERLMRKCHGFIGIFPLSSQGGERPPREFLMDESKYFRLEIHLAQRAVKPIMVFADERYGTILPRPADAVFTKFDSREIRATGSKPDDARILNQFQKGQDRLVAQKGLMDHIPPPGDDFGYRVGLFLPDEGANSYSQAEVDLVGERITAAGFEVEVVRWSTLDGKTGLSAPADFDWVVCDVGDNPRSAAFAGSLHGRFIPTMRLRKGTDETEARSRSKVESALFGGIDAGYPKDVVRWWDQNSLKVELDSRLKSLSAKPLLIASREAATEYFLGTARRKTPLFLSYCDEDREMGVRFSGVLRANFDNVFDYKDGRSIPAGEVWLQKIYEFVDAASAGILLLSLNYLKSNHCVQEMRALIRRRIEDRIALVPVWVSRDPEADRLMPAELKDIQYLRVDNFPDPAAAAQEVVKIVRNTSVPTIN